MKIIGIELRVQSITARHGHQSREVAIIPCNVEILATPEDSAYTGQFYMNATLHTAEFGDIAIPQFNIPSPYKTHDAISAKQVLP
jgi:hypothetical protein